MRQGRQCLSSRMQGEPPSPLQAPVPGVGSAAGWAPGTSMASSCSSCSAHSSGDQGGVSQGSPGPPTPPLSSLSSPLIPALTSTLHRKRARGSHGFRKVPTGCVLCHPAAGGINWGLGKHILFPECSPGRRQEGGCTLTLAGPWVAGLGVQVEEGAIAGGVGFGQRAGAGPRAGSQAWATAARTGPPWASGTDHQQPQARLPSSAGSGCWGPSRGPPGGEGQRPCSPGCGPGFHLRRRQGSQTRETTESRPPELSGGNSEV